MNFIKIITIIILGITFNFCSNKNDIRLDVDVTDKNVSFIACPGGAIMNYNIPRNTEIHYIKIVYKDFKGEEIKMVGGYLSNELFLPGFIKAQDDIPVEISFLDKNENSSEPKIFKFSVLESAASAIIDNLEIYSHWNGFRVSYTAPRETKGFIHVAKTGINPKTQEMDTLNIETLSIVPGEVTLRYSDVSDDLGETTVIIWTENERGDVAGRKVYEKVKASESVVMPSNNFELISGSSQENDFFRRGSKYLFNGDTNGYIAVENKEGPLYERQFSFVSDNYDVPGEWVFDIKEAKILAGVKIYSFLNFGTTIQLPDNHSFLGPSNFVLYASNTPNDENSWVEMGDFNESIYTPVENRWNYRSMINCGISYTTVEDMKNADPCFASVSFDVNDDKYRYIKLKVNQVHWLDHNMKRRNNLECVSFSEFEVSIKK